MRQTTFGRWLSIIWKATLISRGMDTFGGGILNVSSDGTWLLSFLFSKDQIVSLLVLLPIIISYCDPTILGNQHRSRKGLFATTYSVVNGWCSPVVMTFRRLTETNDVATNVITCERCPYYAACVRPTQGLPEQ